MLEGSWVGFWENNCSPQALNASLWEVVHPLVREGLSPSPSWFNLTWARRED